MIKQGVKHLAIFICLVALMIAKTSLSGSKAEVPSVELDRYQPNMVLVEYATIAEEILELVEAEQNIIVDSAGVMLPVMARLMQVRSGADSVISILHIGDSHVQAGYWTARVRELLQRSFGSAGRGLVLPHKLAEQNEPPNYSVVTSKPYIYNRATSNLKGEPLGFTGIGVTFERQGVEFGVGTREPFNSLTIFHSPSAPTLSFADSLSMGMNCTIDNTPTSTRLVLNQSVDSIVLRGVVVRPESDPTYYGFSLESGEPGVLYHAIGSNGAAFEHFTKNTTILNGGAMELRPDLIIVSLGTNNSYGNNFSTEHLRGVISRFITQLKGSYPESAVLITTPRESGKRLRRGKYTPNKNIEETVNIIKEVAVEQGVAYWDLYQAAGGAEVSEKWVGKGLVSRDRIHMTKNGYELMGDMLYNALASHYNGWLESSKTTEQGDD